MKNKFRIDGETTVVFLSSGDGIKEAIIDTKSLEILNDFEGTFRAVWNHNTQSYYAQGYDLTNSTKKKNVMMHRWLMCAPEGMVVDHLNHDTLDNRKSNLKVTTQSCNMFNLDPRKLQGRVPGVKWYETRQKWRAVVKVNGKEKHLGYYKEKVDAVIAVETFRKAL